MLKGEQSILDQMAFLNSVGVCAKEVVLGFEAYRSITYGYNLNEEYTILRDYTNVVQLYSSGKLEEKIFGLTITLDSNNPNRIEVR